MEPTPDQPLDDFERQLARTPRRAAPPDWRADILATATRSARGLENPPVSVAAALSWWHRLLLRFPLATAGFTAVWAFVFLSDNVDRRLNGRSESPSALVSREQLAQVRAQRAELWQLAGLDERPTAASEPRSVDRPRGAAPRPRSDRRSEDDDRFGSAVGHRSRFLPA